MNPLNEYRKSYITACFSVAVIYAFVAGINQSFIFRFADGIVSGIILASTGFLVWNIFRFALPVSHSHKYRIVFISVLTFSVSAFVVGIETGAVYLFCPQTFGAFVATIPVRAFIVFLIFIVLYFFYELIGDNRNDTAKTPMDSSKMNNMEKSDSTNPFDVSEIKMLDRITVRSGQKIKIIPIEDILYIKADGDYISIHTSEGRWLKEQTMKYTEDRLPVKNFVRIHRSYIVNAHRISRIERYGEKQLVILSNNEKIKISAARYQTLKQILGI